MSGTPAFTRNDVRIEFDWGGTATPGGSTDPAYSTIGTSNFSVAWTGEVIPNFSETYTFWTTTVGGVQLSIRLDGASTWTTLVNDWTDHAAATTDSGQFAMVAGQTYDIEMNYFTADAQPEAILDWSSPSTPQEVIDPLSVSGFNVIPYGLPFQSFADEFRLGVDQWLTGNGGSQVPMDSSGWPLADAMNVVWQGQVGSQMEGTYLFQFQGQANVTAWPTGTFYVNGTSYGSTIPSGTGYNASTNTTTASLAITNANAHIFELYFASSQRTATSPLNSGVTDVHLMRPTSIGATSSYPVGTLFDNAWLEALEPYTVLRDATSVTGNEEANWSDRTLPGYHTAVRNSISMAWEDLVMLSNESGRDMYIQIPMNATDDYITKLANLIKYGSDGVNPYTSPQLNPAYPPLSTNLRVYIEWSNEIWNWSFTQAGEGVALSQQAVQNNTPNGQIINYDGTSPNGNYQRWTALRTVETSNIFRSVWGDASMGSTIRVLLEYQYDNGQNTAAGELTFIDDYFDNGDGGQHVSQPHPVSYYIWGGGGAVYYDDTNEQGTQSAIVLTDPGLESPALASGAASQDPTNTGWMFTGDSGIVANTTKVSPASSTTPGTLTTTLSQPSALGYSFTVGSSNVALYQLGRWVAAGDTRSHTIHLIRASDQQQVASVTVNTSGATVGQYLYGALSTPVILQANTTYYLVSEETGGQDPFYNQDTTLQPNSSSGVTINGAVSATYNGNQGNTTVWSFTAGTSGAYTFGPVDMLVATQGVGPFGFIPDAPQGSQAMYISDNTGVVTQSINFTSAGVYAIQFMAAAVDGTENALNFYFNGQSITPQSTDYGAYQASSTSWLAGQTYGHNYHYYDVDETVPFQVTTPGTYTFGIAGAGTTGQSIFLDNFQVVSEDAIFNGGIPTYWENEPNYLTSEAKYAESYGLHDVAYEGGWGLGGVSNDTPLMNYAKYVDPRAASINTTSINQFTAAGGALYSFGSYDQWLRSDTQDAQTYPLVQGVILEDDVLQSPATNGTAIPAVLNSSNVTWEITTPQGNLSPGDFFSWNILVPTSGDYHLTSTIEAPGTEAILVDDSVVVASGASNSILAGTAYLTAGLHTIMVKDFSGTYAPPTVTVSSGDSSATFLGSDTITQGTWKGVYGSDGYSLIGDLTSLPSYATLTPAGQSSWTWAASTSDVRGLQKADQGATDRMAAAWYGSQFAVHVNLTDGQTHRITIYATDWDNSNRVETVQVVDAATGNVLDTESLSAFLTGKYLSWNISGNVLFNFTVTGGNNAVVNGFFFDPTTLASKATFVSTDTTTQGNWKGVYGADGYNIIGDLNSYPSYATVTPSGQSAWTWATSTTDVRGLQKADVGATDRTAACWYGSQFSVDVDITDGQIHKVTIYAVDWDYTNRAETIQVVDAGTGNVLDTESVAASFHNGIYLSWNIRGNVVFQITVTGGKNAVVNGLFFDPSTNPGSSATLLSSDATTQGSWKSVYGADGYDIIGDVTSLPSYATLAPSGQSAWTWAASTNDVRGLQKADQGATDRIAACWYGSQFSVDVNLTDGKTHQITLYATDWDSTNRAETVQIVDAITGKVLDTESLVASFHNGIYLSWNISGSVIFNFIVTGGTNAVVNGFFFGGAPPVSNSATFLSTDTTTQGNWKATCGADGYDIIGDVTSLPSYATVTPSGQSSWTWAASTTDVRGLQKADPGATDRIAACWYGSQFSVDVNLTDGKTHQITLYATDWDSTNRAETIQVVDEATGKVLDTESISSFHNGIYLSWNISGHVVFNFTVTGGKNAVVNGFFFGSAPDSATFLSQDTTTQGSWKGVYGADGYNVISDLTSYPSYATVTPSGQSSWIWAASTSDARGLLKADPGANDRIAACWYGSQFSINVNMTDGESHKISIYACDWDYTTRAETIQVVDAKTGKILDTESLSSFHNGDYLSWNVIGSVIFVVTQTGYKNAVVSGLFFG